MRVDWVACLCIFFLPSVLFFAVVWFYAEEEVVYAGQACLVAMRPNPDPLDDTWILSFDNNITAYCPPNYVKYFRLTVGQTYFIKVYRLVYKFHPEDSMDRLWVNVYPLTEEVKDS